jgi:predicted negative regulator of RcsB-dependent stress response
MSRLPAAGILYVALSEVLVERNELEAAEAHLAQGLEIGKWSGRLDAVRNAAYALSRLRQARHDTNGALAAIREAESAMWRAAASSGESRTARAQGQGTGSSRNL